MSDQMHITASSLLISLLPPHSDITRMQMSEDSSKLSTILHWIPIVISPVDTAVSLSHDASSGCLTFYICSNSFHDDAMNNATRLLNIMRMSLSMASTGGKLSDLEDEYMAFVTDICWHRLLDKVNNKVADFPDHADLSTMSSVLETIIRLADAWKAWRVSTGHPDEESPKITKMKQKLNHSQPFDTLKHCFEQVFRPLDDTGDHVQQLRCLWSCCYALLKSDFFADVFSERWECYSNRQTWFLYRVYRRIWRLYSYRKGIDVLLYGDLLPTIQGCCPGPPEIIFYWIPRDSPTTIQLGATPDQFISQVGQRDGWRGDLALDSPLTSQARCLWSVNEVKTVNVHSMVSLANFLYSSGIRVMEDRIGTSKRPCALCSHYTSIRLRGFRWQCARSSNKFRVDWAIPQSLGRVFTREDAEGIIAEVTDCAERMAVAVLVPKMW